MEEQTSKYVCDLCGDVYENDATRWFLMEWDVCCEQCALAVFNNNKIEDITHPDYDYNKVES